MRAVLVRVLLAVVLAVAGMQHAPAQSVAPPPPSPAPGPAPSDNSRMVGYVVGGVVLGILALAIGNKLVSDSGGSSTPPPFTPLPPPGPDVSQLSINPPARGSGGGTHTSNPPLRRGFDLPPPGVIAYRKDELLLETNAPDTALEAIAARHHMTRVETVTFRLTGRTMHRWHIDNGIPVTTMIGNLATGERQIAGAQPNYVYALAQDGAARDAAEPMNADQYAPQKLNVPEAHRLATGNRVLIAVIDSGVDAAHPDLQGAITGNFDAAEDDKPHPHGTGMAGAIAAHRSVLGIAPRVGLLTVRAFSAKDNSAEGTTFNIIKGLDWAAAQGARIVNMSFAGPPDPRLHDALAKARAKGMVLIAAAGNAGPNSPPLYPAADANVIAVTATDTEDALFPRANRGNYIAVAAPGVDVLVPAPDAAYQFTTGTSVAAAEVSGVAALLIERNPALTPANVRDILMRTARDLGPKGRDKDFGAGLVNALDAVTSASRPSLTH